MSLVPAGIPPKWCWCRDCDVKWSGPSEPCWSCGKKVTPSLDATPVMSGSGTWRAAFEGS